VIEWFVPESDLERRLLEDPELLEQVLDRAPDRELLRRFVELDASTLGKNPAFLEWFRTSTRRLEDPLEPRAPGRLDRS
jgi:hypothetical protein